MAVAERAKGHRRAKPDAHNAPRRGSGRSLVDVTAAETRQTSPRPRGLGAAVVAAMRQLLRQRIVMTTAGVAALVTVVLLVPVPTAVQLRDWATSVGPWFPLAFLGAHIVVTVFPFPRTAFTLAAGLLFGPALGISLAVVASTLSALIALLSVRAAGWQFSRLLRHPRIDSLDTRLRRRGWPAIMSLRLIPAVPFSVLNYAAGASAVRTLPYTLSTLVGLFPGTAAVVVLGNAMTGDVSPLLFVVSLATATVGVMLLIYEVRSQPGPHSESTPAARPTAPAATG